MKRVYSRLTLSFISCTLLMSYFFGNWISEVKGTEQVTLEKITGYFNENENVTFQPPPVNLTEDGIRATFLIDYRWFNFRLVYDNVSETYSVYSLGELVVGDSINKKGELVAENMPGPTISTEGTYNPLEIMEWFEVKEEYNLVRVYYYRIEVLVVVPENSISSVIQVLSPKNITYDTSQVPLEYKVNRAFYTTTYSLDKQENITIVGSNSLAGLEDGTHHLTVYINCTESTKNDYATVWFTVDTRPPIIKDVTQSPIEPIETLGEGVRVKANVTDAVSGIERVVLNYSVDNGTWVTVEMTNLEGDLWNGIIPGFTHGTNVTYTILAKDKAENTVTTEELFGAPNQYEILPELHSWTVLSLLIVATLGGVTIQNKIGKKRLE